MKNFVQWQIKEALTHIDSQFIFKENMISIKSDDAEYQLKGKKIYTVIDNDQTSNIVTLTDQEGNRYKFNQNDLTTALASSVSENSTLRGFQILQYPVGYALAGSGTELMNLSIFDSRINKEITNKKVKTKK